MSQHRLDELRVSMQRPTNCVAHTNHTRRLAPAFQPLLVHHDERTAPPLRVFGPDPDKRSTPRVLR
jgi:hypothetical protein